MSPRWDSRQRWCKTCSRPFATSIATGITCVLVEQNVAVSLRIANRAYVLENGRVTLSGTGAALLADERVRQAYLGI